MQVQGSGFRAQDLVLKVEGLRIRVRVHGFGLPDSNTTREQAH